MKPFISELVKILRHFSYRAFQFGESFRKARLPIGRFILAPRSEMVVYAAIKLSTVVLNSDRGKLVDFYGATRRSRTDDLLITNQLLYQLS